MSAISSRFCWKLRRLYVAETGQDLIEYALLVSLIALAVISGMNRAAGAVTTMFSHISASLAPATQHSDDNR